MLKNILIMLLKVMGVLFVLVMIVAIAGAILNPGKAKMMKDDLKT